MSRLRSWLREPLLHFAVAGALAWAVDRATAPEDTTARVIRLDQKTRAELTESFTHRQGRAPSAEELESAAERWLEEEVLYREGLALGLGGEDVLIRNRVIEKMRFVLSSGADVADPSVEELEAWFKERQADYQKPRRYDLEHVEVSGPPSASARKQARGLLSELSAGSDPLALGARYRRYERRTAENIAAIFGSEVEGQLAALTRGRWHLLESPDALHLVRLGGVENASPPRFDELEAELRADWKRQQQHARTREKLRAMRGGYIVQRGDV